MQLRYETNINQFDRIPGSPFSYWCKHFEIFDFPKLSSHYISGGRNKTHNNDLFLRNWWEIFDVKKWQPYANGGEFRKWYGNNTNVVDWSQSARQQYNKRGGLYNEKFWGKEGICWNLITSYKNGFRLKGPKYHYSSGSPTIMSGRPPLDSEVLGFLNTNIASYLIKLFNPTLNTTVSDVLNLPYKCNCPIDVSTVVSDNIALSTHDWDSFETSRDFKKHPLV